MTPKNLHECFEQLDILLSSDLKSEIENNPESFMSQLHSDIGRAIRNEWGLWVGSELSSYFNGLGLSHADDMSGVILTSYWRVKHNRPINLDEQVKHYLDWWSNTAETDGI